MLNKVLLFVFFCFWSSLSFAQAVDNISAFRAIPNDAYWRLHYDNDFFTATDQFYTQGVNLEVVHPGLRKFPLSKLLLGPKNQAIQYGIAMIHDVYSPSSIRHSEIILNDRPYCANWMLTTFAIATDSAKQARLSSFFSIGVLGTVAGGADMQTSIHRWLNNIEPLGWKNQIHSDVAINYQVEYERLLISYKHLFSCSGQTSLRLGTLNDKGGAGFTFMAGYFDIPFDYDATLKNFRFYVYDQPFVNVVGYDATLEGGMFNRTSPYSISATSLTHITFQNNFGVVFRIRKLYLEYSRAILSKEFKTGISHSWGGVGVGCVF
jgi:lipid A 3-O-deacylase